MVAGRPLRAVVALVAGAALALGAVGQAHGHTSVRRTWPAPSSTVDGVVDEVTVEFLDAVRAASVVVVDPAGAVQPSRGSVALVDEATTAVAPIEPLRSAGEHVVTVRYRSLDGDQQTHAFSFGFEPAGTGDRGSAVAVIAVAALAVGSLVAVVWWRRRVQGFSSG